MNVSIYKKLTGEFVRAVSCPEEMVLYQYDQETEGHLLGTYGDDVYFFDGQVVGKPPQPSPHHTFDYTTKQWVDPRTLQDFKDTQWSQIKQARQSALTAPLTTAYGIFDADDSAQANLMKSVVLANNLTALGMPVAIDYTLANNTTVLLNAAQMIEVGLTLAAREQAVRGKATLLRAAIEAATTQGEVEAVVW